MRATSMAITGLGAILVALMMPFAAAPAHSAAACADSDQAIGVSRIVEIDVSAGPLFGDISSQKKEPSFLGPKEVVLTFDDGPMPWITNPILKTLDQFCTKATFFSVGRMALAYPATVRSILARGHTLGGHTWSHPLNLNRLSVDRATDQIERGFAAIALAAGRPIAPFFRFPGLSDSRKLLSHLQQRGIGTFTVDVVSDDSFISDPDHLARLTLSRVEKHGGGILLFHDIKRSTAKALPVILAALKSRGYKIVHLRPKAALKPLPHYTAQLAPVLANSLHRTGNGTAANGETRQTPATPHMMPFYGTIGPGRFATMQELGPPVTPLAPPPRSREKKSRSDARDKGGKKSISAVGGRLPLVQVSGPPAPADLRDAALQLRAGD